MRRRVRPLATVPILALALIAASAAPEPPSPPQQEEEVVLGSPSPLGSAAGDEERIWAEAGTSLLQYPDLLAPLVDVLPTGVELPVLERRGDWVAVRYQALKVWFALGARLETPVFELPPLYDHERRLRRARSILGGDERVRPLGPFTLHTDVSDGELLELVAAAAADLERAYGERYGLRPRLLGNETVFLFRDEEDYRRQEEAEPAIAGLDPHGYASATIAMLAVGRRQPDEVRQLLLHELTHLLNRRALARRLPPWLEEGLAEDLSYCALDERGRLDPATLSGRGTFMSSISAGGLDTPGLGVAWERNPWGSSPRAALAWLLHSWKSPARPRLEALIDLPWTAFVEPGYRNFHYAESGFLIRYLLDERSGLAPGLRALLGEIAAGEEPTSERLWSHLGLTPGQLEEGFYTWLRGEAAANGVPKPIG